MTILALSLDFDGCLFHPEYLESKEKDVVLSNKTFLDSLREVINQYSQSILLVGSNRQSKEIDFINDLPTGRTGSCFPAIEKISRYLDAQLDKFLLADIYGNLPAGTSFEKAINDPEATATDHINWKFDDTKATVLYAQIHKIAQQFPEEEVVFAFYDDRGLDGIGLLENLSLFYSKYSALLPQNVTLTLNHYAGGTVTPINRIKGIGFIDDNYSLTVREMMDQHVLPRSNHPNALTSRTPMIGTVQQRNHQLEILAGKIGSLREMERHESVEAAETLHASIHEISARYFQEQITKEEYRLQAAGAIREATLNLAKHLDWTDFLKDFATSLGIKFTGIVAVSIFPAQTPPPSPQQFSFSGSFDGGSFAGSYALSNSDNDSSESHSIHPKME